MDDSKNLFLVTGLLSLFGIGLYMYKTNDNMESNAENQRNEEQDHKKKESLFKRNFWDNDDDDVVEKLDEEVDEQHINDTSKYIRARSEKKTKRNNKPLNARSKRRYY